MTEGGDIAFRVFFKGEAVVDLVPLERVQSDLFMEEGQLVCEHPGKCNKMRLMLRFTRIAILIKFVINRLGGI